jgi:hypothetical protein
MSVTFDQGYKLLKEVCIEWEWNPKLWLRGCRFFFPSKRNKIKINKILAVRLERLFWVGKKVGCSFFLWTWAWPLEASHSGCSSREAVGVHSQRFGLWAWPLETPIPIFYWLCFFSPFLWTLNKVWPLNPTASRLGWP